MTASRAPARVRAILELVRPHVDEIVLAADARAASSILGACADLVDRPLAYEFEPPPARYIGWIHHQCTKDWILRLDDDEVPSAALLERIDDIVADRRPTHVALPRRHVFPDGDRYLAAHPWAPDYQVRLVQNLPGIWRFDGRVHHGVEVLGERRREVAPVYHLHYALAGPEERRRRALAFERLRPGASTEEYPVNALYLPEHWTGADTEPVPETDRPLVARVLDPPPVPPRDPPATVRPASVSEVDRFNAFRPVVEDAYRARLTVVDRRRRLPAGAVAHLEVLAENLGGERWPAPHHEAPLIRLAYRWRAPDGTEIADQPALRTPFEETVAPGQATRVMLAGQAPPRCGTYVLEVDVVHELVRWFECPTQVTMAVERLDEPPAASDEFPGPALARPDLRRIPVSHGLDGVDVRPADLLPAGPGTYVEAEAPDGVT